MVTRVRVEASDRTKTEVHDQLLAAISDFRQREGGGEWLHEEQFQETSTGWWGYMIATKKPEEAKDGTDRQAH